MTTLLEITHGHQIIRMIHMSIGMIFLINAVLLLTRSFRGYVYHKKYSRLDNILSYAFLANLYLQLLFGLFLIASPDSFFSSQDVSVKMAADRFWPIEHMILMLFALLIANLGMILSNNSQTSRDKYRKILIYYSISIVMIVLSLSSILFF